MNKHFTYNAYHEFMVGKRVAELIAIDRPIRGLTQIAQRLLLWFRPLRDYMGLAADRYHYDFFFRRSLFSAIVLLLLLNVFFDWLLNTGPILSTDSYAVQTRNVSNNTLIVLNAVPRTTLAQKRIKVPVIREVTYALEEIDLPKPEFGAIEIGPEHKVEDSGSAGNIAGQTTSISRGPELMLLVPPVYPKDAEKKGIEGTVGLLVLVSERGTVVKVEVETSSGNSQMDEAAVKAARKTRFRPAIKDGERVAMWINYPIRFGISKRNN